MNNTKDTAQPKLFICMDIHKRSLRIPTATDLFQGKDATLLSMPETFKAKVKNHFLSKPVPGVKDFTFF